MRRILLSIVVVLVIAAVAYFFGKDLINQAQSPTGVPSIVQSQLQPVKFSEIVKRVSPAVVTIVSKTKESRDTAIGSGFVIDADGYIVTNDHVINNASQMIVHFEDGTQTEATLVGTDKPTDVALLKVSVNKSLPYVSFGDDTQSQVGDWVLAIGSPDFKPGTVTAGILSARGRDGVEGGSQFTDYLQIDAAINHGNSGGPTFNMAGEVIGMNTLASYNAIDPKSGVGERNEGLNFAIPASTMSVVVKGLRTGRFNRGLLGVVLAPISANDALALGLENRKGALITSVVPGGPAEKAGLKSNDVVLKVDGKEVESDLDCLRKISLLQPGQTAVFTIWRDKAEQEFSITVVSRDTLVSEVETPKTEAPVSVEFSAIGITLQASPIQRIPSRSAYGVFVGQVAAQLGAEGASIRKGDRITAVGSQPVTTIEDVAAAIAAAQAQKAQAVILYLETPMGGKTHTAVKLKAQE